MDMGTFAAYALFMKMSEIKYGSFMPLGDNASRAMAAIDALIAGADRKCPVNPFGLDAMTFSFSRGRRKMRMNNDFVGSRVAAAGAGGF